MGSAQSGCGRGRGGGGSHPRAGSEAAQADFLRETSYLKNREG